MEETMIEASDEIRVPELENKGQGSSFITTEVVKICHVE
jgi:hypothetical protein